MTKNIKQLNYHRHAWFSLQLRALFDSIFELNSKKRITVSELLACDWLLNAGKESHNMKDNQSTIFMESNDQMFKYDN